VWLRTQEPDVYSSGIFKLVPGWDHNKEMEMAVRDWLQKYKYPTATTTELLNLRQDGINASKCSVNTLKNDDISVE
jgi:hypothetical protein